MDILLLLPHIIDLRSFSNLWFWIMLAVIWSRASHRVMGVPWDLVMRARRRADPEMVSDVMDLAAIHARRLLYITRTGGAWLSFALALAIALVLVLGFGYHIDFMQALACLMLPLVLVAAMSRHAAGRICAGTLTAADLFALLSRQRIYIQMIGMVAIFLTTMWGMYRNLSASVLGN